MRGADPALNYGTNTVFIGQGPGAVSHLISYGRKVAEIVPRAETGCGRSLNISFQADAEATSLVVMSMVTGVFVTLCKHNTQSESRVAVRNRAKTRGSPANTRCSPCGLNAA